MANHNQLTLQLKWKRPSGNASAQVWEMQEEASIRTPTPIPKYQPQVAKKQQVPGADAAQ
jgi:hypothetical protein